MSTRFWRNYILQGTLFTMGVNGIIAAIDPEARKEMMKSRNGWGLTRIVLPIQDAQGRFLRLSAFPNVDYVTSLFDDLPKFFENRKSAFGTLVHNLWTGVDFRNARLRPDFKSADTVKQIVSDLIPTDNIFFSTIPAVLKAEDGSKMFKAIGGLARTAGMHTSSSYPNTLREEEEFLIAQAGRLKETKNLLLSLGRATGAQIVTDAIWRSLVRSHYERVKDWEDDVKALPKNETKSLEYLLKFPPSMKIRGYDEKGNPVKEKKKGERPPAPGRGERRRQKNDEETKTRKEMERFEFELREATRPK